MKTIHSFACSILIFCISCGGFKYKLISKTETLKLYYIDSKKIGKRVKSELTIGLQKYSYNIYIGYKGASLHVIRYKEQLNKSKTKDGLDAYREMEFLITDTLKNNNPNYFGNYVNGYYADTSIYMKLNQFNKIVTPVNSKEYIMFDEIKDLLSKKEVEFQAIDSTKVIGWFKYAF